MLEDNPYGLLRYEGEPLPTLYSLDAAGRRARGGASDLVIYLGTFSKILSPGLRLGWAVAPRPVLEKLNLGKQGADLCSSPVTQLFVAAYFDERDARRAPAGWRTWSGCKDLYRTPPRRDARGARASTSASSATLDRAAGRAVHLGDARRAHRHDRPARAGAESEGVAFVPGRAAYVDGRSGASSMRLNFAGVPEEDIREGIRRIGRAMREQRRPARHADRRPGRRSRRGAGRSRGTTASAARRGRAELPRSPTSSTLPRRDGAAARRRGRRAGPMSARAAGRRAEGRPLAGAHGVAALGRAGQERARAARPRGASRSTPARSWWRSCARREPDAAFIALHGRDGEDGTVQGLLEAIGIPYTGSGPAACMRCTDKVLAKHLMREAGIPTPDFHSFTRERRSRSSARRAALADVERGLGFPLVVKPASQGSALGVKFARAERGAAGRAGRRVLLRPQGPARALRQGPRPGRVGARRRRRASEPRGAAGRRGGPARGGLLRLRVALRDRDDHVRVPGGAAPRRRPRAPRSSRSRPTGCSAATASRAST